jgi:hypothetical protein
LDLDPGKNRPDLQHGFVQYLPLTFKKVNGNEIVES